MSLREKVNAFVDEVRALLGEEEGTRFNFSEDAAGQTVEIQCARPGEFKVQGGKRVKLSEADLRSLAKTGLDPEADHLLKVGHKDIETDTPDYGRVTGLRYDDGTKRLLASVVPTPAGIKKNREEGFKRVSMEIFKRATGPVFDHLSMLAAHRPAIAGLDPVAFAEGEEIPLGSRLCFSMAEDGDEGELIVFDVPKPVEKLTGTTSKLSAPNSGSDLRKESEMADTEKLAQAEADKAAADERAKVSEKRLLAFAGEDARRFLAANVEKIGLAVRKAGAEALLVMLAGLQATSDDKIKFSGADGKEMEIGPYDLACRVLLAGPEQLTEEEKKETTTRGSDDEDAKADLPPIAQFAGADPDGDELYKLAQAEIEKEKKKSGTVLSFSDAGARVMSRRSAAK